MLEGETKANLESRKLEAEIDFLREEPRLSKFLTICPLEGLGTIILSTDRSLERVRQGVQKNRRKASGNVSVRYSYALRSQGVE